MIPSFVDIRKERSFVSKLRRNRLELLLPIIDAFPTPVKILDVGGTAIFWERAHADILKKCQITILNIVDISTDGLKNIFSVKGDARNLKEYPDFSFDICFSNSVIEHVGTLQDQSQMANEIGRVAKCYFVQTPYRYFVIEPHFLLPFWQLWPIPLRVALFRRFRLGWMGKEPNTFRAKSEVEQIRLISIRELRWLFPEAQIYKEKLGPFIKSLIAIRR
jgi:hypothetical protein